MHRLRYVSFLLSSALIFTIPVSAQNSSLKPPQDPPTVTGSPTSQTPAPAPPIPANAPRMSKQTRLEIIRDFETQIVYARTFFPMGTTGIKLKDGVATPTGPALQQALAIWGPAVKPGDPAHLSYVQIKDDHIHFDINGGPVHRKKWYEHIQVQGANGNAVQMGPNEAPQNPHGTYLDVYFDKYVPEMTARQLRDLLLPVLDFNARSKEEAYLDTVPPKVKAAIQAHEVLVGMNTEMVIHSRGKPPKKVREKENEIEYEEWIYGDPPHDVDFVRIIGDEVVRIETMKVGGQKIVRTEKEVILEKPEKDTEAKQQDRSPNAPSLRRPGEDPENAPKPEGGISPVPVSPPVDNPQGPGQTPGQQGPGDIVPGHR